MLTVRWREWGGGGGKGISIIALVLFKSGCYQKIYMSKISIDYMT